MIKQRDVIGALIVLSCYFFITPITLWSFFAIIPFIIGVTVCANAMSSPRTQGWRKLYLVFAGTTLAIILVFMWIIMPTIFILVYITPLLIASSSLTIAHFTNDNASKPKKKEGAPF